MPLTGIDIINLVTVVVIFLFSSLVALLLLSERGFSKGRALLSFIRWFLLQKERRHRTDDEDSFGRFKLDRRRMDSRLPWLLKPKVRANPTDPKVVPGEKVKLP